MIFDEIHKVLSSKPRPLTLTFARLHAHRPAVLEKGVRPPPAPAPVIPPTPARPFDKVVSDGDAPPPPTADAASPAAAPAAPASPLAADDSLDDDISATVSTPGTTPSRASGTEDSPELEARASPTADLDSGVVVEDMLPCEPRVIQFTRESPPGGSKASREKAWRGGV